MIVCSEILILVPRTGRPSPWVAGLSFHVEQDEEAPALLLRNFRVLIIPRWSAARAEETRRLNRAA